MKDDMNLRYGAMLNLLYNYGPPRYGTAKMNGKGIEF